MVGKPLVSIRCLVYNHELYLRQCLDGFVMQKTTFPFEAIVHDDASTDKSADIIREYAEKYPDIIKPIFEKENQYSKHKENLNRILNEACRGEYIAFCEGDDYWIDSSKLQEQVVILEEEPKIGLVFTDYYSLSHGKYSKTKGIVSYSLDDIFFKNPIRTMTVMVRSKLLKKCYEFYLKIPNIKMFDLSYFVWFSVNSNIYYYNKITSIYRFHLNSLTHNADFSVKMNFYKNLFEFRMLAIDGFKLKYDKHNIYVDYLLYCYKKALIYDDCGTYLNMISSKLKENYKYLPRRVRFLIYFRGFEYLFHYTMITLRHIYGKK